MLDLNELSTSSTESPPPLEVPLKWHFPEVIDNTARSAFRKCEQYTVYQTFNKIKPATPSIHLHAGAAFARGLEMTRRAFYEDKLDAETALAKGLEALIIFYGDFNAPEDSVKSCERMAQGLISYFNQYPLATDYIKPYYMQHSDAYGIEFSFAIPIEDNGVPLLHPETGNPILYAGKFDMLAEKEGVLFVEDEKTTSQLGNSWLKQWDLDSQFTGYCWGAKSYGLPVAGAIIRGVSFLKASNGHAEAVIFRPQWQIDRWHKELVRDVKRMLEIYKTREYSMALDKSICGNYGGCSFEMLCTSPNPEQWIPINFVENTWNPLHKEE